MEEPPKTPNWMNHDNMLCLYKQAQAADSVLEPDITFLSDPHLGRYREYHLKGLELPENIWNFLNKVGLPDLFRTWRCPSEEKDDRGREHLGIVFSLRNLHIEKIGRREFLIIGEDQRLHRSASQCNHVWSWWKDEECSYIAVELKTGKVWEWLQHSGKELLSPINSSLEQYLLSMAYWQAFYPMLDGKVKRFLKRNPEKTKLEYIFKYRKSLYAPFLARLKALDPEIMRKRQGFWKFMCDLTLL